jgi:hypothetical protein
MYVSPFPLLVHEDRKKDIMLTPSTEGKLGHRSDGLCS